MVEETRKVRVEDIEQHIANLREPMDDTKQYFDATASILALAESHRQQTNKLAEIGKLLQLQGEINGKLLTQLGLLQQQVADMGDAAPASGLILPDRLNS